MSRIPQPGDKVTSNNPGWTGLVLTVTESKPVRDSAYITAEHRWTRPEHRTANGILLSPAREIVDLTSAMAEHFTLYAPTDIPVLEPIDVRLAETSVTDLLEWSIEGKITNEQYDSARREDDRRRAAMRMAAE